MRSRYFLIASLVSVGGFAWAGPTAHLGRELTKGVGQEIKKETKETTGGNLRDGARAISSGVAEGVSEHSRDIDRGARDLGRAVAHGFFLQLEADLGADGSGPLSRTLAASGERTSGAIVRGSARELSNWLPECSGKNRADCVEMLIQRYAYVASVSAARGAVDGAPPWPSMFIGAAGFAAGLLFSAVTALLLGQRRTRRQLAALRPQTA